MLRSATLTLSAALLLLVPLSTTAQSKEKEEGERREKADSATKVHEVELDRSPLKDSEPKELPSDVNKKEEAKEKGKPRKVKGKQLKFRPIDPVKGKGRKEKEDVEDDEESKK